ncbi:casein kinase II regulatory subunit-domain-containing protein [Syncephalis plumigaleata]|nr:casein kinase II regulatory subunit-domain-containing protein [Syncephalis plumigaleata]
MWSGTLSFARPTAALPVFSGSQANEDVWEGSEESGSEDTSWISWFCSLPGHDYFCEVEEEFIEDDFNLTGLSTMVSYYQEALEMILDIEPEDESITEADAQAIESSAAVLYGLIHQRFILTRQGMQLMMHKYDQVQFGECPRVYCMQTPMLPCSLSDVRACRDLYHPPATRHQHLDGK